MAKQTKSTHQQPIPEGVKGWSWGAFLLTWIWGIGNKTYRSLWCLVPVVGLVMWIVLGFKGREWAWKHKQWDSVEQFNKVQKRWSIAGFMVVILTILIMVITQHYG